MARRKRERERVRRLLEERRVARTREKEEDNDMEERETGGRRKGEQREITNPESS